MTKTNFALSLSLTLRNRLFLVPLEQRGRHVDALIAQVLLTHIACEGLAVAALGRASETKERQT